jgi:hypothetical protein
MVSFRGHLQSIKDRQQALRKRIGKYSEFLEIVLGAFEGFAFFQEALTLAREDRPRFACPLRGLCGTLHARK